MNIDRSMFPPKPAYAGRWWSISFEPIIGSGERINAVVVALGFDGKLEIIQSVRDDILEAIYGYKSESIKEMITWIRTSLKAHLFANDDLNEWRSPVSGFSVARSSKALDDSLSGILRQAVRMTASLGTLALEAERSEDEDRSNQRQSEQWATKILDEVRSIEPRLLDFFGKRIQLSNTQLQTKFGFYNDVYASNFGLMVPSRLSASINSIKAKIYDLESLSRSAMVIKPQNLDIIIGTPSFEDPTIPPKTLITMRHHIDELTELSQKENINFKSVNNAYDAAVIIVDMAA
ncbi:hypothetical protein ACF2G4_00985 [Pantoea sp. C3]|uniref:hypothetical protein n=1 Tax=Pantoea phytostimulans TaxID=2769024 RepID=UPI0038F7666C